MITKPVRIIQFALLSVLAFCFAGCKSVPMPKGTSQGYSTVRYIAPNAPLAEDQLPRFVEAHRMIKAAVESEMENHGLKMVDQNADLIVAHLIILQDNVSTSYSNQYFGLKNFSELVDLAHKEGMKESYPEKVLKRAVVIDLMDAKTNKLVYRDYALTGSVAHLSEAERQEHIQNLVAQALQKFFR